MRHLRHIIAYIPVIALMLLAFWEIARGISQALGFTPSGHHAYRFTGTFYNPGPYACFLAVVYPVALRWIVSSEKIIPRYAGACMAAISAILIPATASRTAIMACAAGCAVAVSDKATGIIRTWTVRQWAVAISAICIVAAGAYFLKKGSADGRMLMWKVAAMATADAPVDGYGWDKVAGAYGEAQERYFGSGAGTETEILVADAPGYVFNEYLQVAIAFGIPAAILMASIIAGGIGTAMRGKELGLAGAATAAAIVMFSSYPLQFPLFVITIGIVLAGCYLSSARLATRVLGTAMVAGACALFLTHNHTVDIRSGFSIGHSLHKMNEFRKSNGNLLALLPHSSDPMILNIIGKNYQALGMPDSAEHYLMKSVNRCPNRMYPHYLLMRLYSDSASRDRSGMIREAETILNMREKISSPAVEEMRDSARAVLSSPTTQQL